MLDQFSQFIRVFHYPLSQRRYLNAVRTEPIVEIVAKCALGPQGIHRAIGCGDNPSVESQFFVAADRTEFPILQYLQQFDLSQDTDFADLV